MADGERRRPRVLVADDDAGVRYTLGEVLATEDVEVVACRDGQEALGHLQAGGVDLVLTDLRMPRMDGMSLLRAARELPSPPKLVLITAHGSERTAVEAMKLGAYDYFRKPFEIDDVVAVVRRALESVRLAEENERLRGALELGRSLVFRSSAMERLAVLVGRVAPRDVTVLITGESGTGKERVAEAIVRSSRRADGPFVRFNCAAMAAELAEAELFGHTKGAFTGATRDRPGLFREADGGTLLLDEIGELSPGLQAKLLRVLQEGEVRPVGEDRSVKIDVRILAATHRDLVAMGAAGTFREDLRWRLDVVRLHVPPLRERPDDVAALARHFLERATARFGLPKVELGPDVLARLRAHDWPGNVRELEHAIERAVVLSEDGTLDPELLPGGSAPAPNVAQVASDGDLRSRVDAFERRLVLEALEAERGNRSAAARRLGISRVTLHDKLRRYGVTRDEEG